MAEVSPAIAHEKHILLVLTIKIFWRKERMKLTKRVAAVILVVCMMASQLLIAANAYDINPKDPETADMDAGIKLEQKSYDSNTGILTMLVSGKLSNTDGYSSVGLLFTFYNTKLTLVDHPLEYGGYGEVVIDADDHRLDINDTNAVTHPLLTKTGVQARPYSVKNQDVYRIGERTAFYTFIHNDGTAPNNAQKTLNWIPIMEFCFKVKGAPAKLETLLNRDSIRFGDV